MDSRVISIPSPWAIDASASSGLARNSVRTRAFFPLLPKRDGLLHHFDHAASGVRRDSGKGSPLAIARSQRLWRRPSSGPIGRSEERPSFDGATFPCKGKEDG